MKSALGSTLNPNMVKPVYYTDLPHSNVLYFRTFHMNYALSNDSYLKMLANREAMLNLLQLVHGVT